MKREKQLEGKLAKYENAHTLSSCLKEEFSDLHSNNPKKPGRPVGHKGITRPYPDYIDKKVKVRMKVCPDCQARLGRPTKIEFNNFKRRFLNLNQPRLLNTR